MKLNNICQSIGNTPLVRFSKIAAHLKCNVYGKCEFFNPGGSTKDRIALRMVEDAESSGKIRPGDTIIEASSGNVGIGLALVGAAKGYHVVVVMPDKMSEEKQLILEALGAEVVRTPITEPFDSPNSHIGVAKRLQKERDRAFILDQYSNPSNPLAHMESTAQEIWEDLEGKVDMCVVGVGTGGTLSGLSKALKQKNPNIQIVAVDPKGSILAGLEDDYVGSYQVEGIGYDFVPDVLERKYVNRWYKSEDKESFMWTQRLILEEGILCGGSSGAALAAVMSEAQCLNEKQNCVVILPDGSRNYLSKFLNPEWMASL